MMNIDKWQDKKRPLIAILTARKKDGRVAGNVPLFIEIQRRLISLGGISFIFTLDGIEPERINGLMYDDENHSWKEVNFPFPHLVYNRIPFRKTEQDKNCELFFNRLKEKNIPFFNPRFIDKYELYCLFKKHEFLQNHIPDTIPVNDKQALRSFLEHHENLYLKPVQSARGIGIFKLQMDGRQRIHLESLKEKKNYPDFQHFWSDWENVFSEKNYIAQEEIKSCLHNGKRFDFRILAHAQNDGYQVTGIGIRQSQEQELTTHIPAGGKLVPYQGVQTEEHDQFITKSVEFIGNALSEQFGFFGEFSIDACISQSGQYYIYEVNSKPMSFDEKDIEERRLEHLCRLFLQLTGFDG